MARITKVEVNKIVDFNFFYIKKIFVDTHDTWKQKKRTPFSVLFLVAGTGFEPVTFGL